MPDIIITPSSGIIDFFPVSTRVGRIEGSGNTINLTNPSGYIAVSGSGLSINTTSPNALLHAYSSISGATLLNIEGTNGSLFSVVDSLSGSLMSVNNNAGLPVFEVFSDDSIIAGRFGQNDWIITSGGNIGIGTGVPSSKFHVVGTSTFNGDISSTGLLIVGSGTAALPSIEFIGDPDTGLFSAGANIIGVSTSGIERLRINNIGYIGVGTTAPSGNLDVSGVAYFGATGVANNIYIRTGQAGVSETALKLRTDVFSNLYLDATNAYVKVGNQSADVDVYAGGAGPVRIGHASAGTIASQTIIFRPAATEYMRLTGSGYLGIGTSTPSGQLHVVGTGIVSSRLGIGINSPSGSLHVIGTSRLDNISISGNKISATNAGGNLILETNAGGSIQVDSGGNSRGNYSIDLQKIRGLNTQVSSGEMSVIGGGGKNRSSAVYTTVGGGYYNSASSEYSSIGGGRYNTAGGSSSTIAGGSQNSSSNYGSIGGGSNNVITVYAGAIGGGGSNTVNSTHGSIGGGYSNTAAGSYSSVVGGGSYNSATNNYATIGGGRNNSSGGYGSTISGGIENNTADTYATVGGGYGNSATGGKSTIAGGQSNTASAYYATVGGGVGNIASGARSTIGGGDSNSASGDYSITCGGKSNSAGGINSIIGGGRYNQTVADYSTIAGGYTNYTGNTYSNTYSKYTFIGGGKNNTSYSSYSTIGGGVNNTISSDDYGANYSTACVIGGGHNNAASGSQSVVGGGQNNTAGGYQTTVAGGKDNTASNYRSAIGGGYNNTASATYSTIGGGSNNTASGYGSCVIGTISANATLRGEVAHAAGPFGSAGDAQHSMFVLRTKTTNNTATEMALDGNSERLSVASEQILSGTINIVGSRSDGSAVARYLRQFTIKNVGGTTSLVGSIITLGTDEASGTSISITANNTNDFLSIQVTGISSQTWRWVAVVDCIKTNYGI